MYLVRGQGFQRLHPVICLYDIEAFAGEELFDGHGDFPVVVDDEYPCFVCPGIPGVYCCVVHCASPFSLCRIVGHDSYDRSDEILKKILTLLALR